MQKKIIECLKKKLEDLTSQSRQFPLGINEFHSLKDNFFTEHANTLFLCLIKIYLLEKRRAFGPNDKAVDDATDFPPV